MSYWQLITPLGMQNLIDNPSFELGTTGWSVTAPNTIERSSEQASKGAFSCKCTYQTQLTLAVYAITMPAAGTYTVSCLLYVPSSWSGTGTIFLFDAGFVGGSSITIQLWDQSTYDTWVTLETEVTVLAGDLTGDVHISTQVGGLSAGDYVYMDAVQVESGTTLTPYCDGDQSGCSWDGAPHASTSTRSAVSRAGGESLDFQDDLSFDVSGMIGAGMAPIKLTVDDYAILPGGILNSAQTKSRQFSLVGTMRGTSQSNLHSIRQTFIGHLSPFSYPKDDKGWQPVRIRYTGASVEKEIGAHYRDGLGGSQRAREPGCYWETASIRFLADDPYWYSLDDASQILDTNNDIVVRYIVGRLRSTGQWDDLSVGAGGSIIYSISIGPDGRIYVGGGFASIDGVPNTSRIAVYDPVADTWAALQNGATDGIIYATIFAADGTLYAGGSFTSMDNGGGPVANTTRIASWDGTNWAALGTGASSDAVRALTIGLDGVLYAGGGFGAMGGIGNTASIAAWDGTNWSSISSGIVGGTQTIWALATGNDGLIYAGGNFTSIDGVTVNAIGEYDPVADIWYEMDGGRSGANSVRAIDVSSGGILYAGGDFTDMGSGDIDRIAMWNGTTWLTLGSGVDAAVYALTTGPDGIVYAGGSFTEAGGISLADKAARWNGASWAHLDIDLPGAPSIYSLAASSADAIIPTNYDIFMGFSTIGTAYFAGVTTTTNGGTAPAYPRLVVERTAGTSAILETLRNETTGKELLFDYSLLDGEILTIDLEPTAKSIVSNFFGARPDAILPNSDFGEWSLIPGTNDVTCFVSVSGATVVAYLLWRDVYESYD